MKPAIPLGIALAAAGPFLFAAGLAQAQEEEVVKRSSHPRGIAGNGQPPGVVAAPAAPLAAPAPVARPIAGAGQQAPASATPSTQTGREGVNLGGTTRVDARAGEGIATAAGTKNAAGNRVGVIGGKPD